MSSETAAKQRARYHAAKAAHRCTECASPVEQTAPERWPGRCPRCVLLSKKWKRQYYLKSIAAHRCVSCGKPAIQRGEYFLSRCPKHLAQIADQDKALAKNRAIQQGDTHVANGLSFPV